MEAATATPAAAASSVGGGGGGTQLLETECSTIEYELQLAPGPRLVCVVLHPWARLGGNMHDPVVAALFDAARRSGLFGAVVRYNSRSAGGRSAAKFALRNLVVDADVLDVMALVEHAQAQLPPAAAAPNGNNDSSAAAGVVLVGYSFGALLAASCLEHLAASGTAPVLGYVGVGFPLGGMANLLLRSRAHWSMLSDSPAPKLVVQGTRDRFSSLSTLREYAAQFHRLRPAPGPLALEIVDGADHFFAREGELARVCDKVVAWLQKVADGRIVGAGAAGAADAPATV